MFNDAVYCQPHMRSMIGERMSTEQWWKDNDRGKVKASWRKPVWVSVEHYVHAARHSPTFHCKCLSLSTVRT